MNNKIAFGITTFLRDHLMMECVKASINYTPQNSIIIVADQGYKTGEKAQFKAKHKRVQYNYIPFDCGLSAGRNFLVKKAKELSCKYIVIGADSIFFEESMQYIDIVTRCLEDTDFDLIGFDLRNRIPWEAWINLIPGKGFELDFLRRKTGEFNQRENYQPYIRDNNTCVVYPVELVKNFFLAKVDALLECPWDEDLKTCFHPKTPIIIKDGYDRKKIKYISSLFPKSVKQNSYYGYKKGKLSIWTPSGWKKLLAISKKSTKEKMYKIFTNTGCVFLTENHPLVINKKEIKAKDLKIGDTIEINNYPKLNSNLHVNKDWAWLLGFFLAEGTCKRNKAYRIEFTNQNITFLKKCEKILNKIGIECKWYIDKNRKDRCNFLRVFDAKLLQSYFDEFYIDNEKNIPYYVYNFDISSRKSFLKGFHDGDGFKSFKFPISICQKSANIINGLIWLNHENFKSWKIKQLKNKHGEWFTLNLKTEFKEYYPNKITKIEIIDYGEEVYDLECEDHIFCAGINNISVHNCEHEDFFYRFKEAGKKVGWTQFCSGNYVDEKPSEYKRYRDRMYSEFRNILQKKYNITGWISYKNYK